MCQNFRPFRAKYSMYTLYLFIHPSLSRYIRCFHPLALVNNAAMNIGAQARIRGWVAISSSRRSSNPGTELTSRVCGIGTRIPCCCATGEAQVFRCVLSTLCYVQTQEWDYQTRILFLTF